MNSVIEPQTITVYAYAKLSEGAKNRAREAVRNDLFDCDWNFVQESINDEFTLYLEERGLPTDRLEWSLSYSQGDGVVFCGYVDVKKYMEFYKLSEWGPLHDVASATVDTRRFGPGIGRIEVAVELDEEGLEAHEAGWWMSKHFKEFEEHIKSTIKDVEHELMRIGYAEIEFRSSDEYVVDHIEATDVKFFDDGAIVPNKYL